MKKIYKLITLVATILSLPSCGNDRLDRKPTDGIPLESAITNYNDALTAHTGMYDSIQRNSNSTSYYGARMFYYGDVHAEDMQVRTQGTCSSSCYGMRYTVDDTPNMWDIPYSVIHRANRLIQAISEKKVTGVTKAQIGKIYSEALVVGVLVHLDLARIHDAPYAADNEASLDVPVILRLLERNDLSSRNAVTEVYTRVIKDLTDAINFGYLAKDRAQGYINEWAAKTLLTRVYLTENDNENALKVVEDIITNFPHKLWISEKYVNARHRSNEAHTSEMTPEVINTSNDDQADRSGITCLLNENGYTDVIVTKSFMVMLDQGPKGVRTGMVLPAQYDKNFEEEYGDVKIFINKFSADKGNVGEMCLSNLPLLHLSEIYLSTAEATTKFGGHQDKAAKYLNEIALRANPKVKAVLEAGATVERITLERRKEMIGEGQCYLDTLRNNETIVRYKDEADKGYHYSLIKGL